VAQAVEVRSDVAGAARSGEPSRVERRDVTGDVLAGQGPTPGVPGSEGAQRRVTGLANVCLCCMCVDTSFEICGHLPIFMGITTQQGGDTGVTTHARTAMADAPLHAVPVGERCARIWS
jgi:hypothetical protein